MVWYFIGVYIVNRTLHCHLEIRNFSSNVEKIFQQSKSNFVTPRDHVISAICLTSRNTCIAESREALGRWPVKCLG